jgi:hypothetical protein
MTILQEISDLRRNMTNLQKIIGLTEEEARKLLSDEQLEMRVTRRGKENYFGTCDWRRDRVNVAVDSGLISEVFGVG